MASSLSSPASSLGFCADFNLLAETKPLLQHDIQDEHMLSLWLSKSTLLMHRLWTAISSSSSSSSLVTAERLRERMEYIDNKLVQCMGDSVGCEKKKTSLLGVLQEGLQVVWRREKREGASSVLDLLEVLSSPRMRAWWMAYFASIFLSSFKPSRRDVHSAFLADSLVAMAAFVRERLVAESVSGLNANLRLKDIKAAFQSEPQLWISIANLVDPVRQATSGAKGNEQQLMKQQLDRQRRLALMLERLMPALNELATKMGIKSSKADAAAVTGGAAASGGAIKCVECEGELDLSSSAAEFASMRCSAGCVVPMHEYCWTGLGVDSNDMKVACLRAASKGCSGLVQVVLHKTGGGKIVESVLHCSHKKGSEEFKAVRALIGKEEIEPVESDEGAGGSDDGSSSGATAAAGGAAADGAAAAAAGDDEEDDAENGGGGLSMLNSRHHRGLKLSNAHTKGSKLKNLLASNDGTMFTAAMASKEAEKVEREAKRAAEAKREAEVRARREEEEKRRAEKAAEEAAAEAAKRRAAAQKRSGPAIEIAHKGNIAAIKRREEAPSALASIRSELAKTNKRDTDDDEEDDSDERGSNNGSERSDHSNNGSYNPTAWQQRRELDDEERRLRRERYEARMLREAQAGRADVGAAAAFNLPERWVATTGTGSNTNRDIRVPDQEPSFGAGGWGVAAAAPKKEAPAEAFPPLSSTAAAKKSSTAAQSSSNNKSASPIHLTPTMASAKTVDSVPPAALGARAAVAAPAAASAAAGMPLVAVAMPMSAAPLKAATMAIKAFAMAPPPPVSSFSAMQIRAPMPAPVVVMAAAPTPAARSVFAPPPVAEEKKMATPPSQHSSLALRAQPMAVAPVPAAVAPLVLRPFAPVPVPGSAPAPAVPVPEVQPQLEPKPQAQSAMQWQEEGKTAAALPSPMQPVQQSRASDIQPQLPVQNGVKHVSAPLAAPPAVAAPAPSPSSSSSSIPLAEEVIVAPPGAETATLLVTHLTPLLSSTAIGQLFSHYGNLRIKLLLTQHQGLTAVILFDGVEQARRAQVALNGLQLQLQVSRSREASAISPVVAAADPFFSDAASAGMNFEAVYHTLQVSFAAPSANGAPADVRPMPQVTLRAAGGTPAAQAAVHAVPMPMPQHYAPHPQPVPQGGVFRQI
jgi:hypothetical protein